MEVLSYFVSPPRLLDVMCSDNDCAAVIDALRDQVVPYAIIFELYTNSRRFEEREKIGTINKYSISLKRKEKDPLYKILGSL